ncbi:MAG TPA: hypothetical protein VGB98_00095, partial [Pyrinomonadaceae bacterium]
STLQRETTVPAPASNADRRLNLLLEAFSCESMKLLDYLDSEYFEDITDDPRFEPMNKILSLYMVMKRDPDDPNLERFFSELERLQL